MSHRRDGHTPRKRFGQNFLHDPLVIDRIVRAIAPRPGDHIVEIGPGLGAITEPLLRACGELEIVELDRDLVPRLEQKFAPLGGLTIHQGDALQFDFAALAADGRPLRIVGNLPYNISTPLIFHLLESAARIGDMHFMLQKEVVDRLAAQPGGSDYGRLSVMVQYRCAVTPLFHVGPGAFDPPPKVDSAVVRLAPYATRPHTAHDEQRFGELVGRAFAQRRKTLRNNLKGLLTPEQIEAVGIDPAIRAERLTVAEFVALANALDTTG